jgi:hypothetical protein
MNRLKRLLSLVLIAVFGLSVVGFAPSAANAQSGISVFSGRISPGDRYDSYRVSGRAGQMFVAWTESDSNLDPQLEVSSPSGYQYWYDDDSGEGLDAQTGGILLENGAYDLYVSPVGRSTGSYTLYYMALDLRSTDRIAQPGDYHTYTLTRQAGDMMFIGAAAADRSNLRPWLEIYAPDGSLLTSDYNRDNDGSAFTGVYFPNSGTYTVAIGGRGQTTGSYRLLWGDVNFE